MRVRKAFALLLGLTCLGAPVVSARATTDPAATGPTVVTASAPVGDLLKTVDVLVAPGSNVDALAVARAELATPSLDSATVNFSTSGDAWPQFFGEDAEHASVVQSYNPTGDPTGGQGLSAIEGAEAVWTGVPGSLFRYEYGGTTTRCPSLFVECSGGVAPHLDGHNDAGWLDLGNRGLLGLTITVFVRATGELLEADVALNSNPIISWSTNGSGFDVQTAFSHEDGHAAGLGHSRDPSAIMYALLAPGQIKRTLSASDVAAIRFLYAPGPRPQLIRRLASLYTGRFVNDFEPGALNDKGEAAFVADVPTGGEGVFYTTESGITEILRSGGTAAGLSLGVGSAGPAVFDSQGDVVFAFQLGPDFPYPFGTGAALFLYQRDERHLSALVVPGQTPAPGGGVFEGAIAGNTQAGRQIAFTGVVDTPGGPTYGAFTVDRDGSIAAIALPGDTLPGGVALFANDPSINQDGDIAFVAQLASDAGESVYIRRAGMKNIQLVARDGTAAPGGGSWGFFQGPRAAGDGSVLFAGYINGGDLGLFLAGPHGAVPVARPGDLMPDGSLFIRPGNVSPMAWSVGSDGTIAFLAAVSTGWAIYTWTRGTMRRLVGSGYFQLGVGQVAIMDAALRNDKGQVLFVDTNVGFVTSLALYQPPHPDD